MLLTIDVGNTQTVVGVVAQQKVLAHWRLITDARLTGDEIGIKVTALVQRWAQNDYPASVSQEVGIGATYGLQGIALCSTVAPVIREMRWMCQRFFPELPLVVVETAPEAGVDILTDNPAEVGTDRVVNAVALAHLYGGPALCVDCGTATTVDVISSAGRYMGGAIAPGINVSLQGLSACGAQLPRIDISAPPHALATNTVDALRAGVVYGFAAQVDGLVQRLWSELPHRDPGCDPMVTPTVVATGGLASVIVPHSRTITAYEPWLTLVGLALIFRRVHAS